MFCFLVFQVSEVSHSKPIPLKIIEATRSNNGQMLEDEQAKVSALRVEREAREGVIELLHKEAMKWMERFALTLNESQELPRLLARAKAVADTYSTPDEVHSLCSYH